MPFSEAIKLQVKHRAAFRCCRCQNIGIEIHHILPESEDGPSTIENAAPLCAKCHGDFGDNPLKRKEIREMREWWYGRAAAMYGNVSPDYQRLEEKLDNVLTRTGEQQTALYEVKALMAEYTCMLTSQMNPANMQALASGLVNIPKPPFFTGSPCQMAGQPCPSCRTGVMDLSQAQNGVVCKSCGLYIPAAPDLAKGGSVSASGYVSGGSGSQGPGGNAHLLGGTGFGGASGGGVNLGPGTYKGGDGGVGGKGGDFIASGGDAR